MFINPLNKQVASWQKKKIVITFSGPRNEDRKLLYVAGTHWWLSRPGHMPQCSVIGLNLTHSQ